MTLGELIKAYRKEHGMSQQVFADACHLSKAYISILERNFNPVNGKEPIPSVSTIKEVGNAMNQDFNDIIAILDPDTQISLREHRPLPSNMYPLEPMEKIPLVGSIACGTPILAVENIEEYIDLPNHIRADYALVCHGDSMIGAGIHDGDIVYIRKQQIVETGQIAAVRIDEEATLKRFYQDDDTVTLMPENSAFRPLTYIGEDINSIAIEGLAVAYTHKLVR